MRTYTLIGALVILVTGAQAQNRNAFKPMDLILGVTVTQAQTQEGTRYTVSLGQNAKIIRSGKEHKLEAIEGFWLLADQGDIGAQQKPLSDWFTRSNNSGGSSAYGFQTQQKEAIRAGESVSFTFSNITSPSLIDHFGYKVKASGVPAHIYESRAPVPEPATLAILGAGLIGLRRRRRS